MVCRREFGAQVVTCRNGHENPDGYSFCGICGEALAAAPKPDPATATQQPLWTSPATRADRNRQTLIGGVAVAAALVVLGGVLGGLALAGVFDGGSSTPPSLSSLKASWARYLYVRTAAVNNEQARRVRNNGAAVRLDFRRESDAARDLAVATQAIKFPSAVRGDAEAFLGVVGKYRSEVQAAAADANGFNVNAHVFAVGTERNALDVAYYRLVVRLQAQ